MAYIDTVIFDLGGVLIDWNPRALFGPEFPDEEALEAFLDETDFWARNFEHDTGNDWHKHVDAVRQSHPHHAELFAGYIARFPQALTGTIPGSLEVLAELRAKGVRLIALTNFAEPTLRQTFEVFPWLEWFDEVVASGKEGFAKPDLRIYRVVIDRLGVTPETAVFVDDRPENVEGAQAAGFRGLLFTKANDLRSELVRLAVLPANGESG